MRRAFVRVLVAGASWICVTSGTVRAAPPDLSGHWLRLPNPSAAPAATAPARGTPGAPNPIVPVTSLVDEFCGEECRILPAPDGFVIRRLDLPGQPELRFTIGAESKHLLTHVSGDVTAYSTAAWQGDRLTIVSRLERAALKETATLTVSLENGRLVVVRQGSGRGGITKDGRESYRKRN